jgi:hypothetical protein
LGVGLSWGLGDSGGVGDGDGGAAEEEGVGFGVTRKAVGNFEREDDGRRRTLTTVFLFGS